MTSYYVYSGAGGSNNGSSWANAFTTLVTAFTTEVAGDTLYVAHDHAESTAGNITLTSSGTVTNPTKIVCVNRAGSVPPVSADRRATAQVSTTTNTSITFAGSAHYDGIIFTAGNSTGTGNISVTGATTWTRFDNGSLRCGSSGVLGKINIGGGGGTYVELNNTTMSFANIAQSIALNGYLRWRNTSSALLGTIPTFLFLPVATAGAIVECTGVDLSAAGSGKTIVGSHATNNASNCRFLDCKLNASVTKSAVPLNGVNEVDFVRIGATGVNYMVHCHRTSGLLIEEVSIIRSGGASDGVTPIAWKIVTTADCNYSLPFECPPIAIWNDTTGSSVMATVEGIWGGGSPPLDTECWIDVQYLGSSSNPQGSFVNDAAADLLTAGVAQDASSATWGGSTTKFKLVSTFTPQQAGWIYARVKCAKASSTFYIDPLVTLS